MLHTHFLHSNWNLRAIHLPEDAPSHIAEREIVANVPGCVHTDLLQAGLISDPYYDRNELDLQWIGYTDWEYRCSFTIDEELLSRVRVDLVCDGLDTIATIMLNGQTIGETVNQHLGHRFDVKSILKRGPNDLAIRFRSAVNYAQEERDRLGELPRATAYELPYNFIRKMACNFGWDWGPTLVTAGIWQSISLQAWDTARIAAVRPLVMAADARSARVDVYVDLERQRDETVRAHARLTGPDGRTHEISGEIYSGGHKLTLEIPEPMLWWPRGYGEQPLYDLEVILYEADGALLDSWQNRIGLRTVNLRTAADEIGEEFVLEINGQQVFCKGANWIPDDCFPTRVTPERYRQRITQAAEANMNMLRVWGGGIYENEAFYRVCDELGVMVWQDFLFACAAYPEEAPFDALVEAEARHQVIRLSPHPSLVLWNGNNENIWGYFDWGWQETVKDRTWGLGFYLELLPRIVAELDPSRPYWAGSPYSGTMDIHPNADSHGNRHVWDVWNMVNYLVYRDYSPRFLSEFGFQAPPTYPTLRRSIPEDQLAAESPAMLHHQKARQGNDKLNNGLRDFFDIPEDFDDWLYLMQLNQARALTLGVEWYRSRQPVCMGTLYWQINDCWPVTSWACVDGYARPKPLWYATRRFYADRLLTIQPDGDELALYAINDTDQPWQSELSLERLTFAGEPRHQESAGLVVSPRSCIRVMALSGELARPGETDSEMLVARAGEQQALWYFDVDKKLRYPEPDYDVQLSLVNNTYRLVIRARTLLRDLAVFVDRLDPDAVISDQIVTLLPGETHTFVIESAQELDANTLTRPPVLRCANEFGLGKT
jgi:beta-mannosidase